MSEKMITLKNMVKTFGSVKAVSEVSFEINKGEIRALIGENGSGKSTLSSLITGAQQADSGTIIYKGKEFSSKGIVDAKEHGIAVLLQEKGTLDGLSVAENIFLGIENKCSGRWGISRRKMNQKAGEMLVSIGAESIAPERIVDSLSFEERKLIEVARALLDDPDLLIVDETTTALSLEGRNIIYKLIEKMKRENRTVIFISHDLEEIVKICDTATVLRDGKFIKTVNKNEMNPDYLRTLMIGRELDGHYYMDDRNIQGECEIVLKAENINLANKLRNVSIELRRGEILGLGGLTECGMHELCKVMFGAICPDSGTVEVFHDGMGKRICSCSDAISNKVAYLPKDRDAESLFTGASIRDNITVTAIEQVKTGIYISPQKEEKLAQEYVKNLSVKCNNEKQFVSELSGGNKQKVVVGKWLANNSEILIMDCPTRGIDVGVKKAIYNLMEKLTSEGKSIIMVSEEMPELIGMSDRIIVLKNGKVTGTFLRSQRVTENDLVGCII